MREYYKCKDDFTFTFGNKIIIITLSENEIVMNEIYNGFYNKLANCYNTEKNEI